MSDDDPTRDELGKARKPSKKEKAAERAERLAAAQAEQRKKEFRRNIRMGSIVVIVLCVVLVAAIAFSRSRSNDVDETAIPAAGESDYGVTIGPPDAPHSIIVYEDFLCPFCGMLEADSRTAFAELAADGKVEVDYRPFNLLGFDGSGFDESSYSARAASAFAVVLQDSGDEVAKKFHDLLYENQPSERGPFPDNQAILDLAVQAGADEDAVSADILDAAQLDWVRDATTAANDAGVNSTPTVILDGEQFRDYTSTDDLVQKLEQAVS